MTLMRYCGLPSAPITGSRVAVTMRVPLPGVSDGVLFEDGDLPRFDQLAVFRLDLIAAVVGGMTSPAVLPSMRSRSTPRYFSAARLISK